MSYLKTFSYLLYVVMMIRQILCDLLFLYDGVRATAIYSRDRITVE